MVNFALIEHFLDRIANAAGRGRNKFGENITKSITMKNVETVIIGAGQAGLITSYHFAQEGHEHVVLEQSDKVAVNWRYRCWDSLHLVTPNWTFHRIPGMNHDLEDADGFLPREKVIEFFDKYVEENQLPVHFNTKVNAIERHGQDGFLIHTNNGTWKSRNVIVATGYCQYPKMPEFSKSISSDIVQMHSSQYRNPALIPGAVLVVGCGHSGSQIAEEINRAGKRVFVSVGAVNRLPRRYRGKDILYWLENAGFFDLTPEQLPPGMKKFEAVPQISQDKPGHSMNLHLMARSGIRLLGRIKNAEGHKISLAPDLYESLQRTDQSEREAVAMIDGFIEAIAPGTPKEALPQYNDGYQQPIIKELDLAREGIGTIIWATGYKFDFSFVKLPVFDADHFPIQKNGATEYPGLYFVGLPWMPSQKSGFLVGIADAAKKIAEAVMERSTAVSE